MPLEGQRGLSQVSLPEQELRELIYHFQSYLSLFFEKHLSLVTSVNVSYI